MNTFGKKRCLGTMFCYQTKENKIKWKNIGRKEENGNVKELKSTTDHTLQETFRRKKNKSTI